MKPVVVEMIETYVSDGVDWMGYPISKENPITFHHIIKKADGGDMSIDNAAPLTMDAHEELNSIEQKYPDAYYELTILFLKQNKLKKPPTEEYWHELREILSKMKTPPAPVKVYRRIM